MDRRDAVTVTYRPAYAPPRRLRFEPQSDGAFERVEEEWNGCRWRRIGSERVTELEVAPTR